MRSTLLTWSQPAGWHGAPAFPPEACHLVLYFGDTAEVADGVRQRELRARFPAAVVAGCSTGGQILGDALVDAGVQAVAVSFADSQARLATEFVPGQAESLACGRSLGLQLAGPGLRAILLLSEGLDVDAGALLVGLGEATGGGVPVLGGLAGDGPRFARTLVGAGDIAPRPGLVAAVGLYGARLRVGAGCAAGWDPFGPVRLITASEGCVLQALDGAPALGLYERYLGPEAEGLPHTGLLYPLRIWHEAEPRHDMLRTLLGVDRTAGTLTFAGTLPVGWRAQLMRGRYDGLQRGAAEAASQAADSYGGPGEDSLAIVVSCVGRRLLMGQRIAEELEAAKARLPPACTSIGFYSYGEVAPHPATGRSELHNQTVTIAMLGEVADG